jgi:hypothetical protein
LDKHVTAITYADNAKRFAATSALVLLGAVLLWPLRDPIGLHEPALGIVAFGTREAEAFVGRGFRREGPGNKLSWIIERPATIHGVLPKAPLSGSLHLSTIPIRIKRLMSYLTVGKWGDGRLVLAITKNQ